MPPDHMINKGKIARRPILNGIDFLKAVFTEEKSLMTLSQVKQVHVPMYDELSVKELWPMLKADPQVLKYFPDTLPKGRVPDRNYFWNIVYTIHPDYVATLVKHANEQRNAADQQTLEADTVEVTDGWWTKLNAHPFITRKSRFASL